MKAAVLRKTAIIGLLVLLLATAYFASKTVAAPQGVSATFVSNSTANTTDPGNRTDPGGFIYTISVDTTQQDVRWKAYVGNITGKFTLDDASGYTIYDWNIDANAVTGEIYATRNNSVQWSSIDCANNSLILAEDSALNFAPSATDNIAVTFNTTTHQAFIVSGTPITASTCRAIATFVNDTRQNPSESAFFQEVLLADDLSNLVYTAILEQDGSSYKDDNPTNTTYDFQMILADEELGGVSTTYYFYVELG